MKKLWIKSVMGLCAAVLLAGCGSEQNSAVWNDLDRLKKENTDLSMQVQSLQAQNDQLTEQVQTLSGLDKSLRLAALGTLDKIRLNKRTGFYDLDKNGVNETLVVYVEPLDTAQDYAKAIESVKVELWNLNAGAADAKLAEWTLEPAHMQNLWGGNVFAGYYRLPFDIATLLKGQEKELTVKVTFTDFLSGKIRRDQVTITP